MKCWYDGPKGFGCKCHLVEEINDEGATLIVYKQWSKAKQRWRYQVKKKYLLEMFEWKEWPVKD